MSIELNNGQEIPNKGLKPTALPLIVADEIDDDFLFRLQIIRSIVSIRSVDQIPLTLDE